MAKSEKTERAKILFVSSYLPFETPFAGSKTSFRVLKRLSLDFDVDVFSFCTKIERPFLKPFRDFCGNSTGVNLIGTSRVTSASRMVASIALVFLPAFLVARFSMSAIRAVRGHPYRLIYVDWSQSVAFGFLLGLLFGKKVVFSVADIISQSLDRKLKSEGSALRRTVYRFERFKTAFWEARILSTGTFVVVQSSKDRVLLVGLGVRPEKVVVIAPYFNRTMDFSPAGPHQPGVNILFWGALNRAENLDAVDYYFAKFHEELKRVIVGYHFTLAGANPPANLILDYHDDPSVTVTGFVKDPTDVFRNACLSVVPLRLGAGIKVKTLEALYMGLPVVSTEVGAEGIDITVAHGLYVAKSDAAFLKLIVEVVENRSNIDRKGIHDHLELAFNFEDGLENLMLRVKKEGSIR